jgi:hypothetical protein
VDTSGFCISFVYYSSETGIKSGRGVSLFLFLPGTAFGKVITRMQKATLGT